MLFENSIKAWGSQSFEAIFKQELAQYVPQLPLHQALATGNQVSDEPVSVMINSVTESDDHIQIRAGIFFRGLLLGCSCSDDPSGPSETNEYCEVEITLDRVTAAAEILFC